MIEALLPKTRRAILGLLFRNPTEAFYEREIMRAIDGGRGAVQRELANLTRSGLVRRDVRGDRVYYGANEECPIFPELRGLILKTVGLVDVLRAALEGVHGVRLAFVYGSFARGEASAESDVDVIVVGDVSLAELSQRLRPAHERLGREINATAYSISEFREKVAGRHHFLTRVLSGEKLFVIGDAHVLAELGGQGLAAQPSGQS